MTSNPTTNGEKLNQMMQDQAFRKKLEESLDKTVFFYKTIPAVAGADRIVVTQKT